MKTRLLILFFFLIYFPMCMAHDRIVSFKLTCNDGLPDNAVRYMTQDSVGNMVFIWLTGACRYDGYDFTILDEDEFRRLEHRYLSRPAVPPSVHTDNRGNVVEVDYNAGEVRYVNREDGKLYTIEGAFDNRMVTLSNNVKVTVLTDRRGLVWVSVNGNGIFILDKDSGEVRHITADNPEKIIDSDYVVCMTEDRMGNIWVSQDKYGIAVLSVAELPYSVLQPVPDSKIERQKSVRLLRRLADGRIIVADDYASVYISDDELQSLSPYIKNGEENYISAEVDRLGRLWLGSRTRGVVLPDTTLGAGRIDCITRDSEGCMWVCGIDGGVTMYRVNDNGSVTSKRYFSDIERLFPRVIMQSADNDDYVMWLGAGKGLFKFNGTDGGYERIYDKPVLEISDDGKGGVWCGTQGYGVVHISPEGSSYGVRQFTTNDGLTHNTVNSLIVTPDGNIMAGTNDGISVYDAMDNQWQSLRVYDNTLRNYCNEKCVVGLDNGQYSFGTLDGIVTVNSDVVRHGRAAGALPIAITGIAVNGNQLSPAELAKIIDNMTLVMEHDRNSLTLRVSDFSFSAADKSLYSFMLDGYDRQQGPWSDLNFVSYPNLPPGSYTLKVWNKSGGEPLLLNVKVKQAPWATPWAIAGYVTLFLFISAIIGHHVRKEALLRQALAFEKRLTEFKIKFFTDISHEFKVSLTLIMASMHRVKDRSGMSGAMRYRMRGMEHNVNRMTRLVDQLMDFKRLEDDKLRLSLQPTEISAFLRNVYSEFLDYAKKKGIRLSYYTELKSEVMDVDRGVIDKIVYNLLSNALRYTPEGKSVIMTVRKRDEALVISVADTGVGVSDELRQNLFERYTVSRHKSDSIGIGLSFTKELVAAHHGLISYRENIPVGSVFEVSIPIGEGEYDKSDYLDFSSTLVYDGREDYDAAALADFGGLEVQPVNSHKLLFVECGDGDRALGDDLVTELKRTFDVRLCRLSDLKDLSADWKFDLLLCHDPSVSVIRNIRKLDGLEVMPMLLLADVEILDCADALRAGADAVIEKPFAISLLVSQCIALINRCKLLAEKTQIRDSAEAAAPLPVRSDADRLFVNKLDAFIDEHPDVSIDAVCEYFGFSRASLTRKVNSAVGCSPRDYISRRKMEIARQLINDGMYVSEVAEKLGFSTPQNFATSFKRYFGKSPQQYKTGG